ncbi:PIG-L deacetylase family protein [Achromobacter sp.]|uniref:PIG-L deacetylase family protein n=1 Tax=Achromobacter sp. TaxID=134375 RepID=UPI0028A5B6F7|nr:PIG-L family deacetylase [Achromobacter sp.]
MQAPSRDWTGGPDGAPVPPSRLLVVSPHYDDAILSCGGWLSVCPGSTVVTVCSGLADASDRLTDWDRRCGFSSAAEAMARRQQENQKALSMIECAGLDLGLQDSQYREAPDEDRSLMTERLFHAVASLAPDVVAIPLGLFHGDHMRVGDAGLMIREATPGVAWFAYEDVPYRSYPGLVQERLVQLHARGIAATPHPYAVDAGAKARLISAYASQLKGLGRSARELAAQECYWRLSAPR